MEHTINKDKVKKALDLLNEWHCSAIKPAGINEAAQCKRDTARIAYHAKKRN